MDRAYKGEYIKERGYYVEDVEDREDLSPNMNTTTETARTNDPHNISRGRRDDGIIKYDRETEQAFIKLLRDIDRISSDFRVQAVKTNNQKELFRLHDAQKDKVIRLHALFLLDYSSNDTFDTLIAKEFDKFSKIRDSQEAWCSSKNVSDSRSNFTTPRNLDLIYDRGNTDSSVFREDDIPRDRVRLIVVENLEPKPRRPLHQDSASSRPSAFSRTVTINEMSFVRRRSASVSTRK